jgi:hypothetical protein
MTGYDEEEEKAAESDDASSYDANDFFWWNVFAIILFYPIGTVLGVIALRSGIRVREAIAADDSESAKMFSKETKHWVFITYGLSIGWWFLLYIFMA